MAQSSLSRKLRNVRGERRRTLRHDGDAGALRDQPADIVEAGHADADVQMAAQACGLAVDVLLQGVAEAEANKGFAQHVGEAGAMPAGKPRPVPREDHHQPVDEERFLFEMREAGPGRGDAEIGRTARHRLGDLVAGALVQINVDAGMRDEEGRQDVTQKLGRGGGVGHQPDTGAQAAGIGAEVAGHRLDLVLHGARMMQQRLAGRRRHHAAAAAFQQRRAEPLLHAFDAGARRGQRQPGKLGAVGDAAALGHQQEQPEIGEIEAHFLLPARCMALASAFGLDEG